jgi:Zn finger protein HypA/HybF involved in hydrogenase expression
MGLFDKSAGSSSPEFQALVTRWDGFLKKLESRYFEVLQQSEGPLNDVMENIQFDNVIIHNITNGLKNQTVTQLSEKATAAWDKMEDEMRKINAASGDISKQREKMAVFKYWIEIEYEKYQMSVFARAARAILEKVKQHIDEKKMHRCTQCGAELPINVYSFMAVNMKCDSCGSVNTYQPDDRVRALEYYVIEQLAEEHAFPEKLRARNDNKLMKDYWKKYYAYLMENVPDKKEYYQRTMDERLNNPFFTM